MTEQDFKHYFLSRFRHTTSFFSGLLLVVVDAFILMLSIGIGFFIINAIIPEYINFRSFVQYAIYLPPILVVFYAASLYPGILLAPQEEVKRFALCTFFAFMGIAFSINMETQEQVRLTFNIDMEAKERLPIAVALITAWPFATVLLTAGREAARHLFSRISLWGVPAVIYSKGASADIIIDRLRKNPYFGYIPALIIRDGEVSDDEEYNGIPVFRASPTLSQIIRDLNIKVAILCDYSRDIEQIQTQYRYLIRVPKNQLATNISLHMSDFGGILGFFSTNYLSKKSALCVKRSIDILLCLSALPFVILLTLIIAVGIKLSSPGPVFYAHKRIGRKHKEISCWKFRSMVTDADAQLRRILATDPVRAAEWEKDRKFTDDPRVTKFGKFLRRTSLDELPQFWNIFMGEMSFIGPRPVTEPELQRYGKYADYVLSVQPGLSGMWQISGRSDTGYEERITLDTYYIQNWSVWLDVWIIIKTVWVVLRGNGAY